MQMSLTEGGFGVNKCSLSWMSRHFTSCQSCHKFLLTSEKVTVGAGAAELAGLFNNSPQPE